MIYDTQEETLESLMGRSIVDWGKEETMLHLELDDGRILVFMALGIVLAGDHAVH